jgi:murein DD-endopeptidase MepM/ murein hydrolase activator NlpD
MWQLLWGLFSLAVALMIFFKPGNPADDRHKWAKLPTLTPTPSEQSFHGSKLPAFTPTPNPAAFADWLEQWPVEVSSVPIQPALAASPQSHLTGFPSILPGSDPGAALSQPIPLTPISSATPTPLPDSPLVGLPVKGRITQGFGCSLYYTGIAGPGCSAEQPWFHDGLDIEALVDTPVPAMMAGGVIFAGEDTTGPKCDDDRGYGLAVVVDSGSGWRTLYAHLAKISVTTGQAVSPETTIGTVGTSGCVTGPHLHFGLRHNDGLVDPRTVITGENGLRY